MITFLSRLAGAAALGQELPGKTRLSGPSRPGSGQRLVTSFCFVKKRT